MSELDKQNEENQCEYEAAMKVLSEVAKDPLTEEMEDRLRQLNRAVEQSWRNFSGLYVVHRGDVNAWIADPMTNRVEASRYISYMSQDFYENHPDWIIEPPSLDNVYDPLNHIYTHKWDCDDLLISFEFVLRHHYLFGGVDLDEFDAGEIFWDSADPFSYKLVYQYLRNLEGVIPEMFDEKMRLLPRSKIPAHFLQYDTDERERVQITPENAKYYIGCDVVFTTRGHKETKTILGVSDSGKTIQVDHPDLNNQLQLVTRKVYLLQ